MEAMPAHGEEHGAEYFDSSYYDANGQQGDRPALRLYTRLVRRYLRPTAVLDVGCGTGWFLRRLAAVCQADGLEVSPYAAAKAREVSPTSHVYESAADLPAARYDAFTAIHVLEHIPDAAVESLLAELRRAAAPGAKAFFVMPDPAGRAARLHGDHWNALRDPTHINMKPHAEWRAFFRDHGLTVEREGTDGMWNFPYSGMPVPLDGLRHGIPMATQFMSGRMFLRPGAGESSFFVLSFA